VALAQGGTLFLDEIGDVTAAVQVKLLRLLGEQKEYQPLGSTRTEKADVRFVAATNRDLEAMKEQDEYRDDLYWRLNVIPIDMPPLRDRPDDIVELATVFCERLAGDNRRAGLLLAPDALERLSQYDFPGNVRELQNLVERLVVFADGDVISVTDVQRELDRFSRRSKSPSSDSDGPGSSAPSSGTGGSSGGGGASLADRVSEAERQAVIDALERANHNRTQAARLLKISRRTLYNRLTEYDLVEPA
jgi:transcriptional regulator with GAF, ATPase, and Fis domain